MKLGTLLAGALILSGTLSFPAAVPADGAAIPAQVAVSANGSSRIEVAVNDGRVDIHAPSLDLVGEARGNKRFYHRASGEAFVEVKSDDDSIKLRTPTGQLLWKVKLHADKIKVSDNDQGTGAWEIKTKYDDKAKVVDASGTEVGTVKFANRVKIEDAAGKELWIVDKGKPSAAWGVLLIEPVPQQYRPVIVAELMSKGR